jgi:hypothetical protein
MALRRRLWNAGVAPTVVGLVLSIAVADGWGVMSAAPVDPLPVANQRPQPAWSQVISQAAGLGLPTRFLRLMPADFVTVEFEDLHAFAAEYHPEEHRMVLNRALSFNAAGGTLRPLTTLTHREVGTLYHELFHAYLDYLRTQPERASADRDAARVLALAEAQRNCRYQTVNIAPVVQRPGVTEPRYLNDRESWEALNETWAVFVGWAIWTRLELETGGSPKTRFSQWIKRLQKAEREGELIGYYEPDDPSERAMARKRYLAKTDRISLEEVSLLLQSVLELSHTQAQRAAKVVRSGPASCRGESSGESRAPRP